jgi:hypothetical protein
MASVARVAKGFSLTLIPILLPLKDNQGCLHGRELFRAIAGELTERFGGITARTRAPVRRLLEFLDFAGEGMHLLRRPGRRTTTDCTDHTDSKNTSRGST